MRSRTARLSDTVSTSFGSARQLVDAKVIPFAVPAGRKAVTQVRQVVAGRIVPAVENARSASAPVRTEAMRRGRLAATALRGGDAVVVMKRRRWPLAMVFMALGLAAGAGAAWLAQAGRPVELTPYPLRGNQRIDDEADEQLDVTDSAHAHQS